MDLASTLKGDWQGIPVYIPGETVVLHRRHPLADRFRSMSEPAYPEAPTHCNTAEEIGKVLNHWFSFRRSQDVYIMETDGKRYAVTLPVSPDHSMNRLNLTLRTLGATDAWGLEAEYRAREKLRGLLSERQWRHYDLTGTFLETSPRSRVTYLFRRLRPTLALSPRHKDGKSEDDSTMLCLSALCLHPVGYYDETWGGCMTPTDDVIAHLLLMRADEADFWRQANQHRPWRPEAGV